MHNVSEYNIHMIRVKYLQGVLYAPLCVLGEAFVVGRRTMLVLMGQLTTVFIAYTNCCVVWLHGTPISWTCSNGVLRRFGEILIKLLCCDDWMSLLSCSLYDTLTLSMTSNPRLQNSAQE